MFELVALPWFRVALQAPCFQRRGEKEETVAEPSPQELYAWSDIFQILAAYLRLPTGELVFTGEGGPVVDDLRQIGEEIPSLRQELNGFFSKMDKGDALQEGTVTLSELRQDYTRLFTHPLHPVVFPYECLYLCAPEKRSAKRLFVDEICVDVEGFYKRAGLSPSKGALESPDHMATELELVQVLLARTGMNLEAKDAAAARETLGMLGLFCERHFLAWGEGFFARVGECARTVEYRFVSQLGLLACEALRDKVLL